MNPIKSPHQLLLEEAGASLDPSPGLVNTPQQMLMQQANVLPHFAPGGQVAKKVLSLLERNANKDKFLQGTKVVDYNGKPITMYHHTTDFKGDAFNPALAQEKDVGYHGKGMYFGADDYLKRSAFGKHSSGNVYGEEGFTEGSQVMPVHLNIKNPKYVDITDQSLHGMPIEKLKEMGHDGVIVTRDDSFQNVMGRTVPREKVYNAVAFEPTQVKSAIGNEGTYDPLDPRLHKATGGYIDNLSPADMQAALIVNGNTPQHFATGGQSIAGLYAQGAANKAAYDKELADKARAEEATYQNQPPVWQAIPNQDTYSIKARNAFAKQLANLTGNERWSEDTTNDIFGGGADEPLTRSNAIPKAVKTAVQFANPVSTITDIMDAPKEVASQANEGNYLGAGITAGFTGLAALPYFKPAKKLISPVLKKIK